MPYKTDKEYLDILKSLPRVKKIFIGLSILILVLSFFFPAFYIDRKDFDAYADGKYLFFLGWSGLLLLNYECLPWLANPLLFIAIYFYIKGSKTAILYSFLAVLLSLFFASFKKILTSTSGEVSAIASLQLGYMLWTASFFVLFIGTICSLAKSQTSKL